MELYMLLCVGGVCVVAGGVGGVGGSVWELVIEFFGRRVVGGWSVRATGF